jgi:transcriptional regulator with XRE-family HTH domain
VTPRWDLVGLAVGYRRRQLGLAVADVAARIGVTEETWTELEHGRRPQGFHRDQARLASAALGWTDDSLDRIVRGRQPLDAPGARTTVSISTAPAPAPVESLRTGRDAPWILAPVSTRDAAGVRHVDPARVGVLGGLLILVAVVVAFFR